MSLSFYQATVPIFEHGLGNLSAILEKGAAFAKTRKVEPVVMCGLRLTPAMMPLSRQVTAACDVAKLAVVRLSDVAAPRQADDEKDFVELQSRIAATIDYIRAVPEMAVDAGGARKISLTLDGRSREFDAGAYITFFTLPNFYFHITMSYAILRDNGVDLTKQDYEGPLPG